jgi:hypothetical protein
MMQAIIYNQAQKGRHHQHAVQLYKMLRNVLPYENIAKQNFKSENLPSTIANSCIYEKGLAVQQARALYNTINPGVHFNDYYICSPNANRNAGITETEYEGEFEKTDFDISVYPIPADNVLHFEYLCPLGNGKLYLYNMQGVLINEYALPKGMQKKTIITEQLPIGVYTYKAFFDACGTKIGKTSIIH